MLLLTGDTEEAATSTRGQLTLYIIVHTSLSEKRNTRKMPGVGFKARLLVHFLRLSKEYKATLVISPIAFLLFVIGFATPYWVAGTILGVDVNRGLWVRCVGELCSAPDRSGTYMIII